MKYQLINKINNNYSTVQQILYNRGLKQSEIQNYLNLSDQVINQPELLGKENLQQGLLLILKAIKNNEQVIIIIDCDCDGYTSAALLINYLYKLFPSWVIHNIQWYMHSGKQHGLKDCVNFIIDKNPGLVICPDSSRQ